MNQLIQLENSTLDSQAVQKSQPKQYADKAVQTDPLPVSRRPLISLGQLLILIPLSIFFYMISVDVRAKLDTQKAKLDFRKRVCIDDFETQKCANRVPAQRKYCQELEACIHMDWEAQRGIELSAILGDMLNSFIDKLTLRSYILLIIPAIIIVLKVL